MKIRIGKHTLIKAYSVGEIEGLNKAEKKDISKLVPKKVVTSGYKMNPHMTTVYVKQESDKINHSTKSSREHSLSNFIEENGLSSKVYDKVKKILTDQDPSTADTPTYDALYSIVNDESPYPKEIADQLFQFFTERRLKI